MTKARTSFYNNRQKTQKGIHRYRIVGKAMPETKEKDTVSSMENRKKQLWEAAVEIGNSILTAYFLVMMLVYPLYIKNGYQEIGDVKYFFFRKISLITVFMMLCVTICVFVLRRKKFSVMAFYKGLSATDWFVYGYLFLILLSYVCTPFRDEAFLGAEGWYMGLVSQLLFIGIYFLFSRYFRWNDNMLYAMLLGSGIVFWLGILNRYSVCPFGLGGSKQMAIFISTLGNINWFCGYWSVFSSAGIVFYWISKSGWQRAAAGFYVITGFMIGVLQGSSSAYPVLAGVFLFLFILSFQENSGMYRFLELCVLFLVSCQLARMLRYVPGLTVNYESTPGAVLTDTGLTWYLGITAGAFYLIFRFLTKRGRIQIVRWKKIRGAAVIFLLVLAACFVALLIVNTCKPEGLPGLAEVPLFVFNDTWANYRGATWTDGVLAYRSMTPFHKLIGIGPDCFAGYLYTVPELADRVYAQFGSSRLTNAHNEWLTVLVNQGILGLICYAGIFVSAFLNFMKKAHIRPVLYLCAAAVLAYTIHNMVSFQQVLNAPFVFIILGIGEGIRRNS